jgi:galactokinase
MSQRNQSELLGSGSEQIDRLVEAAAPISLAHRVVGSGWGGNVVFFCPKGKSGLLVEELIEKFYLHTDNRVLLSDDLEQYVQAMEQPSTGLGILDPTS